MARSPWLYCMANACRAFAEAAEDVLGDQPERRVARESADAPEGEPAGRKPKKPACPKCGKTFDPPRMEGDNFFCYAPTCRKFFKQSVTGEITEVPSGIDAG